ncbi:MAG: RDD family protein [Microbacterium sp.]
MQAPSVQRPTVQAVYDDEVLTGEAIALDIQPVGLILRAAGAAIDMVLGYLLLFVASLLLSYLWGWGLIDDSTLPICIVVLTVLVIVVAPTAIETVTKGRSLGKLAVGSRVVRADGGAIGFRHAFIRSLVGVLEIYMLFGSLALLVGIFTPRAQRLGDLVAGTYAQRTRTPKLPAADFTMPWGMETWAAMADVGRLPQRLGRRLSQFVHGADRMAPGARAKRASELVEALRPHVSPAPPDAPPEAIVRAVVAVRRDRELRALGLENDRVAALAR